MDISTADESIPEPFIPAHMGKHNKFDLGIICREEYRSFGRCECASDHASFIGADRNILLFFMSRHSNPQLIRW